MRTIDSTDTAETEANLRDRIMRTGFSAGFSPMVKGNWHLIILVGLVVGGMILASSAECIQQGRRPGNQPPAASKQENASASVSVSAPTYRYPYSCETPKDAEQDNLCIELKSAKAAADQVKWAKDTFFVGVAGTIAVIFTLLANTVAAFTSAQQVGLSRKSMMEIERPFVFKDSFERELYT